MRTPLLALGLGLLAGTAHAQTPFQLTLTNTSTASWDTGVFAVLPYDDALLPIGQSPTSGDPYDTYAMVHASCDPYGVEDDGDAALLISRWPSLVAGVTAFQVPALGPGASHVVSFTASPGQVVSFVAHVTGSGDDAAILHALGDRNDATVDLFDLSGRPLQTVTFGIGGYDVNDNGAGASCAGSCPPSVPCYVAPGGGANNATAQPSTGGCTPRTWYPDRDGDGVGDGSAATSSCEQLPGTVAVAGDCDDGDSNVWTSCGSCVDADNDTFFTGCDAYDTVKGPDCDDADVDNFASCATCRDADGDGVFAGCDAYVVRPGPDCSDADTDNWASCASCVDGDGDGAWVGCDRFEARAGPDCDDTNPGLNPSTVWYDDADRDLWGDDATATTQCLAPSATAVLAGGDCADGDPAVNPGATEVCGGGDEDCDGLVDDLDPDRDPVTATTWYADADQDGIGDGSNSTAACVQPPGTVTSGTDCDDADTDNWAACGTCVDGDGDGSWVGCDRYVVRSGPDCDDGDAALNSGTTWYADGDGDGYGPDSSAAVQCTPPGGSAVLLGGDCDDGNAAVSPAATEVCGGGDEDCDGWLDDLDPDVDPLSQLSWFEDLDGDSYGALASETLACEQPLGLVSDGTDCDDADVDNWSSCASCADGDADGAWAGCDAYTVRSGPDCDDGDPLLNDGTVWYTDGDGDGAGDPATAVVQCAAPPTGAVLVGGDCDDADPTAFPGANEVCDGDDEDCDGLVDDADPDVDPTTRRTWYVDGDSDGRGEPTSGIQSCAAPPGYVSVGDDCDDAAGDVFPGAPETCDGRDEDCDDVPDNDAVDAQLWYADGDGDGHGDGPTGRLTCDPDPTDVQVGDDCDDADANTFPGALEFCDGRDQDCDAVADNDAVDASVWYVDGDDDGYGDDARTTLLCGPQTGYAAVGGDCDDGEPDTWPGATELCDGVDNDCDGASDEDLPLDTWWADEDGDGFGDAEVALEDCAPPADSADNDEDCDDTDPDVNPDAVDLPANGIDEDCDGLDAVGDSGLPPGGDRPWTPADSPGTEPFAGTAGCDCDQGGGPTGTGLALLFVMGLVRRRG